MKMARWPVISSWRESEKRCGGEKSKNEWGWRSLTRVGIGGRKKRWRKIERGGEILLNAGSLV